MYLFDCIGERRNDASRSGKVHEDIPTVHVERSRRKGQMDTRTLSQSDEEVNTDKVYTTEFGPSSVTRGKPQGAPESPSGFGFS